MTNSICIKINNEIILNYLENNFNTIKNVRISRKSFKIYNNIIIHYLGNNTNYFLGEVSNIISDLIITFYEKKLISRLININYFYFLDYEKKDIINICQDIIASKEFNYNNCEMAICKKDSVKQAIFNYLMSNHSIVLEGFINFRLNDYLSILDYIVDSAVNKFIVEREYDQLIKLLQLYINTKTSNINCMHLVYLGETSFLIDDDKNLINFEDNIFNVKYLSDISFSNNDYILNTLLTLLPQKLYVHLIVKEDEFIKTLKLIFGEKLILCTKCDICNIYKQSKKSGF